MADIATNFPIYEPAEETPLDPHAENPSDAEHEDAAEESVDTDSHTDVLTEEHIDDPKSLPASQEIGPVQTADVNTSDSKDTMEPKKDTVPSSPAKKVNGGPPTPTVKKIISSGTFGAGSVKPTGSKPSTTTHAPAASKPVAPTLKKTTTSLPASSKPALASSTSAKPAPSAIATSTRRASIVPATKHTVPGVRTSTSGSAKPKPPSENGSTRGVTSPTGSVGSARVAPAPTRPRASVSEAVKKAPLSSRPSVAGTTKPTGAAKTTTLSRSSAAPASRVTRPTSVSSIKEAKEDSTAVLELQTKLEEATRTLELKTTAVSDLQEQLAKVEATLTSVSETAAKDSGDAKIALQAQLEEKQNELVKVHAQLDEITSSLDILEAQLENAKAAALSQTETVNQLQAQIQEFEVALATSKDKTALLEQAASGTAESLEAASIQREALLKAQSDFKAIGEEVEALKATHAQSIQDAKAKITELEAKAAQVESLEAQLASLKDEKDENANKLSELEIEVLELKETQDELEDSRDHLQQQVTTLEAELANAAVASGLAKEDTTNKEAEHVQKLAEITSRHEKELETEAARYAEIVSSLEAVKSELSAALASLEQSQQDLLDKEEKHALKIAALEDSSAASQAALSAEIEQITKELHSQEAIYNTKVDAVKLEHTTLLEEAFEKAKDEASAAHALELQAFRASSSATIEEIKSANKIALDALKADHASSLESEVNDLQKQINKLKVELKATRDDLSKAKAALEASRSEVESLTKQRDAAITQAEATPSSSPDLVDEIARLKRELANTKDDLAAVTDMLNLTKSSMTQLSDNHSRELQEAAMGRADEVLKLRSVHDAEVTKFATQKSELLIQLSDLEGELLTAKAALNAQQTASPRNRHTQPASGVTREELAKLHEAHNLKLNDLQAEHEKAFKRVKEELDVARGRIDGLEQDVSRKDMEIQYMTQDQEETQEQITRLKEDLDAANEKLQS